MMAALLTLTLRLLFLVLLLSIGYRLWRALRDPLFSVPGPLLARISRVWWSRAVGNGDWERTEISLHQRYGPVVRVAPGVFSICEPQATSIIYNTSNVWQKSRWYSTFQEPGDANENVFSTSNNIFAAELHKKYKYAFDANYTYEYTVDECTTLLQEKFQAFAVAGSEIDLSWWMTCFAFDVMGMITFSKRFGHLDDGRDVGGICAALNERLDYVSQIGIFPELHSWTFTLIKVLIAITGKQDYGYIFTRKQMEDHEAATTGPPDMMSLFLKAHKERPDWFTDHDVLMGAYANIVAGADTTWITETSIIYFLTKYPTTLAKLRAEIDMMARQGTISDPVTFKQTHNMPYLQAVVKEAQRMHPATGFPLWRVVPTQGATLCGRFFPAGTVVGVNSWTMHYSGAFAPDQDVFRPERWLDADKEKLSEMNASYMPFGMGPRICQGQNTAMMMLVKLIPQLVRKFDFELVQNSSKGGCPECDTVNHWLVGFRNIKCRMRMRSDA